MNTTNSEDRAVLYYRVPREVQDMVQAIAEFERRTQTAVVEKLIRDRYQDIQEIQGDG